VKLRPSYSVDYLQIQLDFAGTNCQSVLWSVHSDLLALLNLKLF
jgi:hypothetical protein